MSKRKSEKSSAQEATSIFPSSLLIHEPTESKTEPRGSETPDYKKKLFYPLVGIALFLLIVTGAMAKNGWLPATDTVSGKRTGWFGKAVPGNAPSSWNPASMLATTTSSAAAAATTAAAVPTGTPQLSKEYIYAGSRLLAVEDANANAAPPADLAVWRPGNGVWYVLGGAGSQQFTTGFGASGDIPTPGDYDGDGKTDLAVYRPTTVNGNCSSTGTTTCTWYILTSGGSYYTVQFGISSDVPVPADYDGDGRTDIAVFRSSNGSWYILRSSDQSFQITQFGTSGDVAMPQDFDGDGKADQTVLRASTGTFSTLRSSDNTVQTQAGAQPGDTPVPADYDGDGRADYAVRRGAEWISIQSSNGALQVIPWQLGSDQGVPNDYDGDGRVDIAVWRESNGNWYIRQSSKVGQPGELRQVGWGQPGDIPVPAFYRR